jgi:hypothetical protein
MYYQRLIKLSQFFSNLRNFSAFPISTLNEMPISQYDDHLTHSLIFILREIKSIKWKIASVMIFSCHASLSDFFVKNKNNNENTHAKRD